MSNIQEKDIVHLLQIAGGEIVGSIKIQKMVYLLKAIGHESKFDYKYHRFGPYSEDLSDILSNSETIEVVKRHREKDGMPYYTFKLKYPNFRMDEENSYEQFKSQIDVMQNNSSAVLELAATMHWLKHEESIIGEKDLQSELEQRKRFAADTEIQKRVQKFRTDMSLD